MAPIILFRASLAEEYELETAKKYFNIKTQRCEIQPGQLVIPRYSALPFYQEFEQDVKLMGSSLINSYREHCYVADLRNWYYDLAEFTPRTWFYLDQIPEEGPFVLKGQTNSKKFNWNTQMFAQDKRAAMDVFSLLSSDRYIGVQQIYIREYVPLRQFYTGVQGLPISEEYRFFILDGKVLSGGFYWSNYLDDIKNDLKEDISIENVPQEFLEEIICIASPNVRFFVVDVARTAVGNWILIELNDGQQSGLSDNCPDVLYSNMKKALNS